MDGPAEEVVFPGTVGLPFISQRNVGEGILKGAVADAGKVDLTFEVVALILGAADDEVGVVVERGLGTLSWVLLESLPLT